MNAPEWWRISPRTNLRHLWEYVGGHDRGIDALEDRSAKLEVSARVAEQALETLQFRLEGLSGIVSNTQDGRRIEKLEFSIIAHDEVLEGLQRRWHRLDERIDDVTERIDNVKNVVGEEL